MVWCRREVTPVLKEWSYISHALSHRSVVHGTLLSWYFAIMFLKNINKTHKRHPIAHPLGWRMMCILCVQSLANALFCHCHVVCKVVIVGTAMYWESLVHMLRLIIITKSNMRSILALTQVINAYICFLISMCQRYIIPIMTRISWINV